jgi:hypothetical protein
MLRLRCYIVELLVGAVAPFAVWAQAAPGVPKSVNTLFDDLPVHDAAANSVLHENETAAAKIGNNLFVTTALSSPRCVVGQPVLFTATLYSALQSRSVITAMPRLPGFLVTQMNCSNDTPQYKAIAGKTYRAFVLRRLQLLPVQPGVLTIGPLTVKNTITYTNADNREETYAGTVQSKLLNLLVRPLPLKNQPAVFTGLIGSFSLHTRVLPALLTAGATGMLRLEITGAGNFTDCNLPAIEWPVGVTHFPAKEQLVVDDENSFPARGRKIMDIPFVAAHPGRLVLPAMAIAYFDPALQSYKTVSSAPVEINVLPAAEKTILPPAPVAAPKHQYGWLWAVAGVLALLVVYYLLQMRKHTNPEAGTHNEEEDAA